jgi:hypothetical protein
MQVTTMLALGPVAQLAPLVPFGLIDEAEQ